MTSKFLATLILLIMSSLCFATPVSLPVTVTAGGVEWRELGGYGFRLDEVRKNSSVAMRYLGDVYSNYYGYDSSDEASNDAPAEQTVAFSGSNRIGMKYTSAEYQGHDPVTFNPTSDFTVRHEWLFYDATLFGAGLARNTIIYTNHTGEDISLLIEFYDDFGVSGDHRIRATGRADDILTRNDVFFVLSPQGISSGPFTTHIIQGPNTNPLFPFVVNLRRNSNFNAGDLYYYHQLYLPANSTIRIAHFTAVGDSLAGAINVGELFESNASLDSSVMFGDMTPLERSQVVNFAPSTAPEQTDICPQTPLLGGVTWGCEGLSFCIFKLGRENGPDSEDSIESDTEFPIAGEDICHVADTGALAKEDYRPVVDVNLGEQDFLTNSTMEFRPHVPGYLSASAPSFPSSFPATRSTSAINLAFTISTPAATPFLYLLRYGSERVRLTYSINAGLPSELILDGVGERRHRIEEIPLLALTEGDQLAISLSYEDGFGSNNGFYIDQIAMYPQVQQFSYSQGRPARVGEVLPEQAFQSSPLLTVLSIGRKEFAPSNGVIVANEFSGSASSNISYNATFDLDEAESSPNFLGNLFSQTSSDRGQKDRVMKFFLNNEASNAWLGVKTWGKGKLNLAVDGRTVGTVQEVRNSEHNLYTLPIGKLAAGHHSIILTAYGERYLDHLEIYDRDTAASGWTKAPDVPSIASVRKSKRTLIIQAERFKADEQCTAQLWGQYKRSSTPFLLASRRQDKITRRFVYKRDRLKRQAISLKVYYFCNGSPIVESNLASANLARQRS